MSAICKQSRFSKRVERKGGRFSELGSEGGKGHLEVRGGKGGRGSDVYGPGDQVIS